MWKDFSAVHLFWVFFSILPCTAKSCFVGFFGFYFVSVDLFLSVGVCLFVCLFCLKKTHEVTQRWIGYR